MEKNESPQEGDNVVEGGSEGKETHPMELLLDEGAYGMLAPRRGEIRSGTIARITDSDILVDIGAKSEGVIASSELERLTDEEREAFQEGSEVSVYILRTGGGDGQIVLSLHRAEEAHDWGMAEELQESKEPHNSIVAGYNKGGLIVKLGHLRGFVPASQISLSRRRRSEGESPDQRWGKMVGEPIVTKVIEVDRNRNRLILSEKAAAREARHILKERLIDELEEGELRTGHVISLADFGAFVDIGGADGLVHLSEISWKRISHPREALKVGEEVRVKVLSVDRERKRISLSMRELEKDPWEVLAGRFHEGQLIEGIITKLTKFGAFASIVGADDYDVEGLIHISELSDRHVVHPKEVVEEGQRMAIRIIRIDAERRRIGLSLKKVDSPEFAEMDWEAAMNAPSSEEAEVDEDVTEAVAEEAAEPEAVAEEVPEAAAEEVEPEAVAEEVPEAAAEEVEPEAVAEEVPEVAAEEVEPEAVEEEVPEAADEEEVEPEAVEEEVPEAAAEEAVEPEAVAEEQTDDEA